MSYSVCYNCNEMVPNYEKYCEPCIKCHHFTQDENFGKTPLPPRSCNCHSDCNAAELDVMRRNPGTTRIDISFSFHCHDEDCEECFGK